MRWPTLAQLAHIIAGCGDQLDRALWGEFSPDGSQMAYGSNEAGKPFYSSPSISVAPAQGGESQIVSATIDWALWGAHWMPDGQVLILGGNDWARKTIWLQPLDGAPRKLDVGELKASTGYGPHRLDSPVGVRAS